MIIGYTSSSSTRKLICMYIYNIYNIYMDQDLKKKLFMKTHKTSRGKQQRKIEQDEF